MSNGEIKTDADAEKIKEIIEANKIIPFVDRIINKDKYPVITNPNGSYSTHQMAWGNNGDKYVVFPTIEMIDGKLTHLLSAGIDPFQHAMKTNNYISFNTSEEADWFSKNYKKYWNKK